MKFPKLTEYLFTPKDAWEGLKYLRNHLNKKDVIGILLMIFALTIVRFVFDWDNEAGFFWMFIVALFYWKLDSRVSIGAALVCLVAIPLLLTLFRQEIMLTGEYWAERVAVWAYYFLVIGVVKQIIEYIAENKNSKSLRPSQDKQNQNNTSYTIDYPWGKKNKRKI